MIHVAAVAALSHVMQTMSAVNEGASSSTDVNLDLLEEPHRRDSALHPLLEARRAVLQDLAEHPVPNSPPYSQASQADRTSADAGELLVASRAESALDTLSAARATVGNELHEQRAAAYPPDFDASPRSRTSPGHSADASASGGLYSQTSFNTGFGPPLVDNPSQTLEEARRLMLQAGQSSSYSGQLDSNAVAPSGLVRTTSKTLEEARRLVLGVQGNQEGSSSQWHTGSSHAGQGSLEDLGFSLQRDSAQHPLVEARRIVLEDFGRPSSP